MNPGKMATLKVKNTKVAEVELEYVPCLKCGSEDISFWNANESAFNYGGADCKGCGNKVSVNSCWTDPQHVAIDKWNAENDPAKIKAALRKQIDELRAKLKAVPNHAPKRPKSSPARG